MRLPPVAMVAASAELTVPVTATVALVAPLLERVMEPDFGPSVAEALIRTETVPEDAPLLWLIVAVLPKVVPSLATSKSVGAVTVMFSVRFEPVTANVCAADAIPAVAVNEFNVPVVVMDGSEAAPTVNDPRVHV